MTKIFIIAGEASGDYLGSCLINDIKSICPDTEFIGIGGERMEKSGLKTIFSISELSIIGIWEVIGKIFHVKKLIDRTVDEIFSCNPDVIVSIDSSGFTHRVDKAVKKRIHKNSLQDIPIIHYAAPPVWAWRSWRAKSLKKFIDKLLVLFPFEPELFQKYGLETVFVGHPIAKDSDFERPLSSEISTFLKRIKITTKRNNLSRITINLCSEIPQMSQNEALENYVKRSDVKIITLLPGSRRSEIDAHIPILYDFCKLMIDEYKNLRFIIPTTSIMKKYIEEKISTWEFQPFITDSISDKVLAYYVSDAAVAASGTVVLELARTGLPAIVIYKTSAVTSVIVSMLIHVKFVNLVNIILNQEIIPELLQKKCTAKNIFEKIKELLESEDSIKQKKAYKTVISKLNTENKLAAKEVVNLFNK